METTFGPFLYTNNPRQFQRLCERVGMSGDACFSMECLRQFGLTELGLRMSKLGQQWVMLRSNCGRASSFRHGNAVYKRGKEFTLFCLHPLRFNAAESPHEGILVMLIKVERGSTSDDWLVWMNAWCVKFRSYAEAEEFVKRLKGRINAPHPYPIGMADL